MANTLNLGNGNWATKEDSLLAYNSENGNFKPLPFDFTRLSKATVVNKAGLIETVGSGEPRIDFSNDAKGALKLEPERTNLLPYSEDFSQSAWTKSNSTITSNSVISPDGTLNASTLTDNTANGIHRLRDSVSFSASTDYSLSVFAKKGTLSNIQLALIGTSTSSTSSRVFDLENGVLGESLTNQTLSNSKITDYGNGWFKCEITAQFASTPNTYQITLAPQSSGNSTTANQVTYDGDGNGNVYLWGAQLEQASYATSYIPTQGSAVTRSADACNNGGNEQVINSTEGVLYAQISALSNSGNTYRLIGLNNGSGTNTNRIFIGYTNNNSIYAAINDTTIAFTTSSFDVKNFNKVAVVYNGSIAKLFINGSEVGSGITNAPTLSGLSRVDFSGSSTGANEFKGNTKDVRVYNTALTDTELQALTRI